MDLYLASLIALSRLAILRADYAGQVRIVSSIVSPRSFAQYVADETVAYTDDSPATLRSRGVGLRSAGLNSIDLSVAIARVCQ